MKTQHTIKDPDTLSEIGEYIAESSCATEAQIDEWYTQFTDYGDFFTVELDWSTNTFKLCKQ